MSSSAKQFNDPFDSVSMPSYSHVDYGGMHTGESFGDKISDALGFTNYKADYQEYLNEQNREYERASVLSARAWDEYMDSTKYQRAFQDLKKAGANPWLLLQNGGVSAGTTGRSEAGGSARAESHKKDKSSVFKDAALTLLATAKILSLI